MKMNGNVYVAVADASAIVRCGLTQLLKRLPLAKFVTIEVASLEVLHHTLRSHEVDIVLVSPTFGGGFRPEEFRQRYQQSNIRYAAVLTHLADKSLLQEYDGNISLYDSLEEISEKMERLVQREEDERDGEQETLSQREKEIVCFVVKGLTNKEIAEKLFISVHTVITHRRNISRKLQIHSPAGLTIYAIVNKLVDIKEVELN